MVNGAAGAVNFYVLDLCRRGRHLDGIEVGVVIDTIHQSSLNMALRCGEQFRRRYIDGQVIPPGVAAGRGTGLHGANEANMKHKIVTKQDLPLPDLHDAARDAFVKAFDGGVFLPKEDLPHKRTILNKALNDTIRLTSLYRAEVAPGIMPKAVEQEFRIDIGLPLDIAGRMDIQETARVDDLKSAGKSWQPGQIDKEIQPIMYSMAHEYLTGVQPEFVYHILVALKEPKHQIQTIKPNKQHYRILISKLAMMCRMIETGVFLPANPTIWWCSSKFCGYYNSCRYTTGG